MCTARDDVVLERRQTRESVSEGSEGPVVFTLAEGPFETYQRTVTVSETALPGGRYQVDEVIDWELAVPIWGALFRPVIARQLRRHEAPGRAGPDDPPPRPPWWSPPARLDARAVAVLSRLCGLSLLAGYLGTILTQTITFAADDFDASKTAQGATLAAVRFGVLFSLILLAASDRRGRQRLLALSALGGALTAAAGAFSPNLAVLGATQTLSRAFATTLTLLLAVVAAEEMPAGGRAYAVSVLSMTAALGAGAAVALLPLADVTPWAWRTIYLAPMLALPWFVGITRRLPESRRFQRPERRATMAGHRGRLALLAATGFFGLLFLAPSTQFRNDFLRDERGFSALAITLFTFATSTPGGIGIVVGGRLADVHGRRRIGAIGSVGGAAFLAIAFQVGGPLMWVMWILGTIVAAMTVPALTVYGPELFPTSLRAKANGYITVAAVAGSAVGLVLAGRLADHFGRFGPGFALLAAGPMVVAVLVITLYPETANMELEELNPEDAAAVAVASPLM